MSQLRAQNLSAMLQVTAYCYTQSLPSLTYRSTRVLVHGRSNRPCTFLKSIVTGHRTANPPPIPQTITRSTLGSLGYTPMLEYAWVLGVVWYSNDRMVAGLGLLPGTAPNGAPATLPPRLAHPLWCTLLFLGQQCYIGKTFSDDLLAFSVYGQLQL